MKKKKKKTKKKTEKKVESSMNDPTESWGEKIEILKERADDIVNFVKTLATMKEKLQNKKQMVKRNN